MDGMGVGGPPQGPHTAPPTPGPCGPSNGSGGGGVGGGASSPLVVPHPVKAPRPIRTYHCRMCDQVSLDVRKAVSATSPYPADHDYCRF